MTFPHSHSHTDTHIHTISGFLVGFSLNNLCFLVFSSLCSRSMYYLSIAFSRSARTHTRTHAHAYTHTLRSSTVFLEWQKTGIIFCYLLLQMEPSFHDLAVSCPPPPAACFYLFRPLSLFSPLPCPPLCMFMFIQTHLPLFSPPLSLPLYPCVQLLLPASFP